MNDEDRKILARQRREMVLADLRDGRTRKAGPMTTKKGAKGYSRREKHPDRNLDDQ